MPGEPSKTLYLVDVSSFIFRAFFAIRALTNKAGEPTNAVYGVATMLVKLIEDAKPEYLAVTYDSKEPSFREEIYPDYKANRSAPPEDLIPQFDRVEQLVRCLGIHSYRRAGIEADDLIATLTRRWSASAPGNKVVIVTSDKDLMQLVDDRVSIWDTMSNKIYGPKEVEEKFNVRPDQIRDYLGMVGDTSDNIPGIPGVGPKTAADLLREHQTMEAVLKAAREGRVTGKKGETIKAHEKDARLSAELATVKDDLDLDIPLSSLKYEFMVSGECVEFLKEMAFNSLVPRWQALAGSAESPMAAVVPAEAPVPARPATVTPGTFVASEESFRTVNTEKSFKELLTKMDRAGEFGFDLETTSLNPRAAELVGVAICAEEHQACYIPVGHRGTSVEQLPQGLVVDALKPFLESKKYKKIGQNLKYDWSVLYAQGLKPQGIEADTMVASYVLDPDRRHNLHALAATYLNYEMLTYEQVCGKGKDALCFDQVPIDLATRYSAEDALVAVKIWERLKPMLEAENLNRVFREVDLPLVDVLARMEMQGVCIDVAWLQTLSKDFERELRGIEERVGAFTSGPINLNSTKQLGHLLFEELKLPVQGKTKTGYSTDVTVLEALAPLHEVPQLLLQYREISKLKGTYIDPLPGLRDPKDHRIHAGFHQAVAATGRLSSSDPNLQNIPIRTERGRKIRRAFIPSEGNVLVSADYSQIELRLLAHMSSDKELCRSFQADEDVHRRTASEIFGVPPDKVDDRQRGIAKAINFGLMYGKTAFGLSQELKIPRKEAADVISKYFARYSGVKQYLDEVITQAKEHGKVMTLFGRKRPLPDIRSANHAMRSNAERIAMNSPIQGTAADLMKLAMIELDRRLAAEGYDSKLIIQVHDEVVLDCPKAEVPAIEKLVTEVMEGAMKLQVPLKVNAGSGANWAEL